MLNDILKATKQWLFLLFFRLLGIISGLVIVAIAIPFRKEGVSLSDGRKIVNLPKWAWLWGNDFDGLLGDKRGWWEEKDRKSTRLNSSHVRNSYAVFCLKKKMIPALLFIPEKGASMVRVWVVTWPLPTSPKSKSQPQD